MVTAAAIIFDLFDTLTVPYEDDRWRRSVAAMAEATAVAPEAFEGAWGLIWGPLLAGEYPSLAAAVKAACGSLGQEPAPQCLQAAATCWSEGFTRPALTLRPDALQTLHALRTNGIRIGLLSDSPPDVPALWEGLPAARLVDAAVFSCVVGARKPAPALYTLAAATMDVPAVDCLYVADGVGRELTGAQAVGMNAVLFRPADAVVPDAYRADAREWSGPSVSSLTEVMRLVGR